MKNVTRAISCILVCSLLSVGGLTGCKKSDETSTKASTTQPGTTTASKEPVKIKIMNRVNVEVKFDDANAWLKEVEKQANVKLEYEAPPINNYLDRLQIVMASGDLPDVVYIWTLDQNYEKWASEGMLIPLDDKYPKYENLVKNISKNQWEVARVSATKKVHGVPKPQESPPRAYIVNQEWLDKLGMKAPSTLNELYEFAKAVATRDPDGNGKADTFAISPAYPNGNMIWGEPWLMSAFGLHHETEKGTKDVDGNYKIREKFTGYYKYLEFLNKLYTEKLMDPEFFLNKVYGDSEKVLQNRVAIFQGQMPGMNDTTKEPKALTKFTAYPPIANEKGESVKFTPPAVWGAWCITSSAKNVDGILKFLDWGNSQEGFTLMNMGIKGVHYSEMDVEKKLVTKTQAQMDKSRVDFSGYMPIAASFGGKGLTLYETPEKGAKAAKDTNFYLSKIKEVEVPVVKAPKLDDFKTANPDLVKKKNELEIKYVTGDVTMDQLKSFLEKEYFPKIADAEKEYLEIMKNIK
jgi:putative aldouronate transport system substrate-binding protein